MNIYLDIETVPSQDPNVRAEIEASILPPGNYSKPETISKWEQECKPDLVEEQWRKTALDGAYGQIVCASITSDGLFPLMTMYSDNWAQSEKTVLMDLFAAIKDAYSPSRDMRPIFVGHNVSFDLRFILQRSMIHGIRPPTCIPFDAKPWDDKLFDTMVKWSGVKGSVSLDKLCRVFGLPKKGSEIGEEIDGSKVWDFVKAGRIKDVAKYCAGDVERVKELHKRMTFQ
jgi:hypothetical protein